MLIPIFAAPLPFLLWPIEIILPYPYIVEEVAKAILLFFVLKLPGNQKIIITFLVGFLFAFSENVLYLFNIYSLGNMQTLLLRFVLTTPMHILTSFVILGFGLLNRRLIFLGLALASIIHFLFNAFIILGKT